MAILTNSAWADTLLAMGVVGILVYQYLKLTFEYWDKKGVPNTKRVIILEPFLGGRSLAQVTQDMCQIFEKEKYFGSFFLNQPVLVVKDPDLVSKVLIKDFPHFYNRSLQPKIKDPLGDNLFNLKGYLWRQLRYKLTPTFSTGKLKSMFEQMCKCEDNMVYKIDELTRKATDIQPKDFLFEFTTDVVSSCAFDIQMGPESVEFKTFKSAVTKLFNPSFLQYIKVIIIMTIPKLAELFGWNPNFEKVTIEYFLSLIRSTSKYRRENQIKRNDYLQLLLSIRDGEKTGQPPLPVVSDVTEDDSIIDQMTYTGHDDLPHFSNDIFMTDERMAANSVIFLVAGSESTSSTITHTLLELSRHPEVQARLQAEVDCVLSGHQGQWSYQAIKEMVYLDDLLQEVMRLYPIFPFLMREVTQRYQVPGSTLVLEEGTQVIVPVGALHRDPGLHPEPELFKPERFQGNNYKPSPGFLPFGDGPRICIAMRFAILEVKTAVARIMSQFSVRLSPKTRMPLEMEPRSFVLSVKGGVWLRISRRKEN